MSAQSKARIVLVDDQLLFREAVSPPMLEEEPDLVVVARDGYQAGASDRISSELVRSHR